jgi:hypothetical protein
MDDLDPQVVAALARAAKGNPELRSAASAIFAALKRRDEREREAWRIVQWVAAGRELGLLTYTDGGGDDFCSGCNAQNDNPCEPNCPVTRARALLGGE